MRVTFIQAGGITGVSRGCEIDSATLPGPEGEQLAKLVKRLESAPPAAGGAGPAGPGGPKPDAASYLVRVEEAGRTREYKLADGSMTDSAAELVRFLSSRAKPRRL